MNEQLRRVDVVRLETAVTTLASALEARPAAGWSRLLGARTRRRADAFAQALDEVGTLYTAEKLHQVRIAAKKLRYTLELAAKAARVPVRHDIRRLKQVQDLLGQLHDLQMLQLHVQEVAASPSAEVRLARALGRIFATFETECRALHADFVARRPGLVELAGRAATAASSLMALPLDVPRGAPARMLSLPPAARRRRTLSA